MYAELEEYMATRFTNCGKNTDRGWQYNPKCPKPK